MTTAIDIPPGRIPVLPRSYVMGLFGDRGSGKSAVMALYGIDEYKTGRKVIYFPKSYALQVPGAIAMGPLELADVPETLNGAIVLIDEIQELLSKYRSNSTLTLKIMGFFRQVRKRGANVIFTSNDPDGINKHLPDQTDQHGICDMEEDLLCYELGYHIDGCTDLVNIRFKDTPGKYGLIPFRKDGRKGYVETVAGISDVYGLYDTSAIADITEVVEADKSAIMERAHTQGLGMSATEFDDQLVFNVVPQLVNAGGQSITPKQFSKTLKIEMNIPNKGGPLSPEWLGRRLKGLGLASKRMTAGTVYSLPPIEHLKDWQDGLWSGIDDY